MKKIISSCLVLSMLFSLSTPTFAAYWGNGDNCGAVTVILDGEPVNIAYRVENNHITYMEIGNDIVNVENNVVFFNGIAIATISIATEPSAFTDIEPRTGWIYNDTFPTGVSPSDYNTLFNTRSINVTFAEKIIRYSVGAILAVFITIVPFGREVAAQEVFGNVALMVAGLAASDIHFGSSNEVYGTEYIYSGGIPYTRKNVFFFYSDSAKTNLIDSTTCYSSWS